MSVILHMHQIIHLYPFLLISFVGGASCWFFFFFFFEYKKRDIEPGSIVRWTSWWVNRGKRRERREIKLHAEIAKIVSDK